MRVLTPVVPASDEAIVASMLSRRVVMVQALATWVIVQMMPGMAGFDAPALSA